MYAGAECEMYQWIQAVVVLPICLLGLAGNSVSVWAWRTHKKPNAVIRLFQCLGLVDNIYLLLAIVRCVMVRVSACGTPPWLDLLLIFLLSLSIHLTLVIGVFRWLSVSRPLSMWQRITWRHVLVMCVALVLWCALLVTPFGVSLLTDADISKTGLLVIDMVLAVTSIVLPTAVLVGFSLRLLLATFRLQSGQQAQCRKRKMTMAVLAISACSILVGLVEVVGRIVIECSASLSGRDEGCNKLCVYVILAFNDTINALNSSINFFFYFFVASKFRPLLRQAFSCCLLGLRRTTPRKVSTTSLDSVKVTSDSGIGGTCCETLRQKDDKDPPQQTPEGSVDLHTLSSSMEQLPEA